MCIRDSHNDVANVQGRLAACESGITNLKDRIKELENTIEEQSMQAKRGRNTIIMKTMEKYTQLAQQLQETEAVAQKRAEEIRLKDVEHKLAIQEKELRIRELEVESIKEHKESLDVSALNPPDKLSSDHLGALLGSLITQRSKWRNIGSHLGFSTKELDNVQADKSVNVAHLLEGRHLRSIDKPSLSKTKDLKSDTQCLGRLLKEWLKSYPGDSRGSTSFATYTGLKLALVKAGLGAVARDLPTYQDIIIKHLDTLYLPHKH